MNRIRYRKLAAILPLVLMQGCSGMSDGLRSLQIHDDTYDQSPMPIGESALPSRLAHTFKLVTPTSTVLEGASFDRAENLVFSDVKGRRLLRMSPEGEVVTITHFSDGNPGGTAIRPNGEVYVALISDQYTRGSVVAVSPDGSDHRVIISPERGFVPNDLVFDEAGGFYFTDFRGNSTSPTGGVYYVSPDGTTITPILRHLSLANGVALSPDGRTLWVTEYGRNLLHKLTLETATTLAPLGTSVPYRFTGAGPDSMRVDTKGNVYVAMMEQGRVMVFAPNGIPISQVLLPDRKAGHNLGSASLALSRNSDRMCIVASDGAGRRGAAVFESRGLANGVRLF